MTIAIFLEQRIPSFCVKERQVWRLKEVFPGVVFVRCRSLEVLQEALPRATVAVTNTFRPEWFAKAPKLRYILCPAAGRDVLNPVPLVPPPEVYIHYGTFHGSVRFSLSRYNTDAEVDFLLTHTPKIIAKLRALSPFCQ